MIVDGAAEMPAAEAAQRRLPGRGLRLPRRAVPRGREGMLAWALVAFAVAFNAYYLWPELAAGVPKLNDGVLHVLSLRRMITSIRAGQDPTDSWFAPIATGYPFFHYYQHLPYVGPALAAVALPGLGVPAIFNWTQYLLLCAFPVSIYWSMRRFGFAPVVAGLSALMAPLISTNGLYGFDDESYVWLGYGLYTQLWGMVLIGPALAQGYTTIRTGRGYAWSVALVAATLLAHLVLGYIAILSLGVLAILQPSRRELPRRIPRLALLLALAAAVTSYMLIPFLRDGAYFNRSVWELQTKYDAFGYEWTLRALFGGRLFDYGRFRSLTLLAGAGVLVCAWRWRDERHRIPVAVGALWLALYFGRPTWGALLHLLPLSENMQFHRLITGVHLGGIMLMGIALAVPWQWALARKRPAWLIVPAAITVLLLAPVYVDRRDYLQRNDRFMAASNSAYERDQITLASLEARLRSLPPGRVYAGFPSNWGKQYTSGDVPMWAILQAGGFDMTGFLFHALSLNADEQVLFDESRAEQYNLFNVRYVVAPKDHAFPDFVQPVADFGRHRLYRVLTSGYFDLVSSDLAFAGDKGELYPAASGWMAGALPAAKEHPAIVFAGMTPPAGMHPLPLASASTVLAGQAFEAGPSRGEIVSESQGDNSYTASVNVLRPSVLMLKETYVPGWHVTVDGRDANTMMLMPSYTGVQMTPGAHSVRFEYRPPASRLPLLLLGLLLLPAIALAEWRGARLLRRVRRGPVRT